MLEPISGRDWDGKKSLYACLLRAPLCGAINEDDNDTNDGASPFYKPDQQSLP